MSSGDLKIGCSSLLVGVEVAVDDADEAAFELSWSS
jgi:hypothetical protein